MIKLKFARLRDRAIIPSKRKEDAGYDIYPCFDERDLVIRPHETRLVSTGIASVIPEGYYVQIEERGSTGSIGMKRSAGVVDSGYRGEWFVAITNCSDSSIVISKDAEKVDFHGPVITYPYKKAIAQAVLHEVVDAEVEEISEEELKTYASERGDGALGASGK